jgi:lipopolysaccharide export system protein LptA
MPGEPPFDRAAAAPQVVTDDSRRLSPWRQRLIGLTAASLFVPWWSSVQAADTGAATDNRPIAVTADSGIEWQKQAQVYVARGNAVATRGSTQVRADTLTAHYRPGKGAGSGNDLGGNEVYRLDADRHVVISNGADTVTGDQAVYDVGQEIAVITGRDLRLTTATDLVTARDSFEWYDQQQLAVARGDAVAVRGDRRIRADVLSAHMIKDKSPEAGKPAAAATTAKPAAGAPPTRPASAKPSNPTPAEAESSKISRIDAQGHVVVSTPTDIGRGNFGVYDAIKGIVTLLGNVTITRGQDIIRGQYAVVDLNTNVSRMLPLAAAPGQPASRVEGIFVRQDATSQPTGPGATGQNVRTSVGKP